MKSAKQIYVRFNKSCYAGRLVVIMFLALISGCVSLPRGTNLAPNTVSSSHIEKKAWIEKIELLDSSVGDKSTLEDSLALNILEYMREGQYFKEVNMLPGKIGEDDLALQFQFDLYQQRRSVHPAYFPLAIVTGTLYIWFGGPIYTDTSNFSGKIIVKDFSGSVVTEVSSRIEDKQNVSLWSYEYFMPSGIEGRTKFVNNLLEQLLGELSKNGRNQDVN